MLFRFLDKLLKLAISRILEVEKGYKLELVGNRSDFLTETNSLPKFDEYSRSSKSYLAVFF